MPRLAALAADGAGGGAQSRPSYAVAAEGRPRLRSAVGHIAVWPFSDLGALGETSGMVGRTLEAAEFSFTLLFQFQIRPRHYDSARSSAGPVCRLRLSAQLIKPT